jgi:hypothetical protein
MKLHEFQEMVKAQRQAQQLTNLEKIAKIVNNKTEKEKN